MCTTRLIELVLVFYYVIKLQCLLAPRRSGRALAPMDVHSTRAQNEGHFPHNEGHNYTSCILSNTVQRDEVQPEAWERASRLQAEAGTRPVPVGGQE